METSDAEKLPEEEKMKMAEEETPQLADMDAVFERLGGAGRYSVFTLLVMIFAHSLSASITLHPVFTTVQLPFNCTDDQLPIRLTPEDDIFEETAVSRFGLVCDRAVLSNMPTTWYFFGYLFGCLVYGALADRVGRLRVVQASLFNMSVCTIVASQVPNLWLYCLMQMLTGFGDGGITSSGLTYTVECTDSKHRGLWALSLYHGCTLGIVVFTLVAYLFRNYQHQLLFIGLYCLILSMLLCLLCESPRWLASIGRYADADRALRRFDRLNNGRQPSKRRLPASFSTEAMVARQRGTPKVADAGGFRQLLCDASLRPRTLFVWLIFFTVSVAYFGVALGVGRLGGDVFVNQLAAAAVEPPARLLCAFASLRFGRRPSVCVTFGLAGACLLGAAVLWDFPGLIPWRVGVAMFGKFWITMSFDLTYLYATEVFPTQLRTAGVGSGSSVSRAGALASTLVPALGTLWGPLPFLVFAVGPLALAASAPCLMMETMGKQLPEVEIAPTELGDLKLNSALAINIDEDDKPATVCDVKNEKPLVE